LDGFPCNNSGSWFVIVLGRLIGDLEFKILCERHSDEIYRASQSGKVPQDFLKKLQGLGNPTKEPSKSGDGSGGKAAGAGPKTPAEDSAAK